ncbi:MAG: hypothetical protein ACYSU0_13210, partial [Planctomycetota bacterium]
LGKGPSLYGRLEFRSGKRWHSRAESVLRRGPREVRVRITGEGPYGSYDVWRELEPGVWRLEVRAEKDSARNGRILPIRPLSNQIRSAIAFRKNLEVRIEGAEPVEFDVEVDFGRSARVDRKNSPADRVTGDD